MLRKTRLGNRRRALVAMLSALTLVGSAPADPGGTRVVRASGVPLTSEAAVLLQDDERARERWFYGQRAYPRAAIPARALVRARTQARRLPRLVSAAGVPEGIVWQPLGPSPIDHGTPFVDTRRDFMGAPPWSGRVTVVSAAADGDVFAGAGDGGVWKTSDLGGSWTPLFDGQPSLAVGALAVDPSAPNTVFVGTGENNFGFRSYYGAGIFKSIDDGKTWRRVDNIVGGGDLGDCHMTDITVTPGDSSRVLAAVAGDEGLPGSSSCDPRSGIYLSTDSGEHWVRTIAGKATDLAVVRSDPMVWYAGITRQGIFKSTDGGAHWSLQLGGPTDPIGRIALAVTADGSRVMAAVEEDCDNPDDCDEGNLLGLVTSTNGGADWTVLPADPELCANQQCFHVLTAAFDPRDARTLYVGGVFLFRYRFDATGVTFETIGRGGSGIHGDIQSLAFDPANRLWIGDDGGVHRTSDGGATFVNATADLAISQFYPGIAATRSGSVLIGGLQDDGSVRFTGSPAWTASIPKMEGTPPSTPPMRISS